VSGKVENSGTKKLSPARLGVGGCRVATFFLVKHTNTEKKLPNDHKVYHRIIKYVYQWAFNYVGIPKGHKVCIQKGHKVCIQKGHKVCIPKGHKVCIPKGHKVCIPKGHKVCIPKGLKVCQRAINYSKIFHSQAFQNIPESEFRVM
jgi:hypothetical protein